MYQLKGPTPGVFVTVVLFTEISFFCIAILAVIVYKLRRTLRADATWAIFAYTSILVIAVIAFDLSWRLVSQQTTELVPYAMLTIVCANFFVLDLAAYAWFIFSEAMQNSRLVNTQKKQILWGLPFLVLGVLTVFFIRTNALHFDSELGLYQNGLTLRLQLVLAFLYALFTTISAFVRASAKENFVNRNKFLALGFFGLFPVAFGIVQMMFTKIPLFSIGATFGVLLVYFDFQEQLISTDVLTHLNNRSRMVKHLSQKMQSTEKDTSVYLFIIDLDDFKFINDRFGHVEGDYALTIAAAVLKTAAANNDCFLARYGGDEFVLIGDFSNDQEAFTLTEQITTAFINENESKELPYPLHASIGFAKQTDDIKYIPDFIAAADKALYKAKALRKQTRKP